MLQIGKLSDLDDPYKQLSAWYSGVQVINMSMGRAPFQLWKGDRDSEQVSDGPLYRLFKQPNEAQTWRQFLGQMNVHLHGKTGSAFIDRFGLGEGTGDTNMPRELRLLDPGRVSAIVNKEDTQQLIGWDLKRGKNGEPPVKLTGDEKNRIVPIYLAPDPDSPYSSVSPQTPGSLDLDTERMAGLYTASTLASGGSPGLLFTFLGDTDWTPKAGERIEEKLKAKYGSPDGFRMAAVNGDWKVQNLGMRPRDMEFIQWRAWIINVVARLLGITPLILAHYEGATGLSDAGLKVQERINYRQKFIPLGSLISEALQRGVVDPVDPSVEAIFDFSQIEALQEDYGAKLVAAQAMFQMQVPLAQINDLLDLGFDISKIPWASEAFIPMGMVPARLMMEGTPAPEDAQPDTETAALVDEVADLRRMIEDVLLDDTTRATAPPPTTPDAAVRADESPQDDPDELAAASTPSTRAKVKRLPRKSRRTAQAEYVRASQEIEGAMKGKIRKAMMAHRAATLRAFTERAGSSLRAVMRAHPDAAQMTDEEIAAMTTEEVVARAPVELDLADIEDVLGAIESGKIAGSIEPVVKKAFKVGHGSVTRSLLDLGVAAVDLGTYERDLLPKVTTRYISEKLRTGPATLVERATREKVRNAIAGAVAEGKSVKQTATDIRDVFNGEMREGRARVIARTETGIAMNTARTESMVAQGVDEIEWRSVIDTKTRRATEKNPDAPDHEKMNGKRTKMGTPFDNGLMFPNDPNADAALVGEIVNCRCVHIPVARVDMEEVAPQAAAVVPAGTIGEVRGLWFVLSDEGRQLSRGFRTEALAAERMAAMAAFKAGAVAGEA